MKINKSAMLVFIKTRRHWIAALNVLSILVIGAFLFQMFIMALSNGYSVDTFATNGTFQLYNPLQRIAEGQIVGHDFPFFHGVGVVLLHYPLFSLLGENVFAAEVAKYIISPLLFVITSFIFFLAYFKDLRKSLISTALFIPLCYAMVDVIGPGNSLIGLRSSIPVLVAAALLWNTDRKIKIGSYGLYLDDLAAILLLGLAFTFGTEHGIASIVAFFALKTLISVKHGTLIRSATQLIGIAIVLCLAILLLLSIFTFGHPLEALKYALIDIPSDQGWYFGTPPNPYVTWGNLIPTLTRPSLLYIYTICGVALIAVLASAHLNLLTALQKRTFLFMAMTGVVVFAAGVIGGYFAPETQLIPLQRLSGLIVVAIFVSLAFSDKIWIHKKQPKKHMLLLKIALACVTTAFIGLQLINSLAMHVNFIRSYDVRSTIKHLPVARNADDYNVSSDSWKKRLDSFDKYLNKNESMWSTYSSLYDSSIGKLSPSAGGEDYIIHALGDKRRTHYEQQFIASKPKYVVTLKPTYFIYEEWLWARHWNVYEHLLTDYTIVTANDSHILWRLDVDGINNSKASEPFKLTPDKEGSYTLPANSTEQPKVYTLTVTYDARTNLPTNLLEKLPRYSIKYNNTLSLQYPAVLPPTKTTWKIPGIVLPGENDVSLKPSVDGLIPSASVSIQSIEAKEISIPERSNYLFINNYCSFNEQDPEKRSNVCKETRLPLNEK